MPELSSAEGGGSTATYHPSPPGVPIKILKILQLRRQQNCRNPRAGHASANSLATARPPRQPCSRLCRPGTGARQESQLCSARGNFRSAQDADQRPPGVVEREGKTGPLWCLEKAGDYLENSYCSLAAAARASFRTGMSGSASFQRLKKSW